MRRIGGFAVCLFLGICFFSCGSTYKTPVRNDPLFTTKPYNKRVLNQSGDPYTQRGNDFTTVAGMQPRDGEDYEAFKQRVFNTLAVQEYDKEAVATGFLDMQNRVDRLKAQLTEVQSENVELRLSVARLRAGVGDYNDPYSLLFSKHTVRLGETLQKLSFDKYGTHTAWLMLYRFNLDGLEKGPNKLEVGQELLLPNLAEFASFNP